MLYFLMYLITRLDSLKMGLSTFALTGLIIGFILFTILCMARVADPEEKDLKKPARDMIKKITKPFLIIGFISLFLNFLTPSLKEAAVIYLVPKIIKNEKIINLPEKSLDLLHSQVDIWIEDNLKKKEK